MLQRMKKDLISVRIYRNEMEMSLNNKNVILSEEQDRARKSKEAKL
jgi:hypothetical protein